MLQNNDVVGNEVMAGAGNKVEPTPGVIHVRLQRRSKSTTHTNVYRLHANVATFPIPWKATTEPIDECILVWRHSAQVGSHQQCASARRVLPVDSRIAQSGDGTRVDAHLRHTYRGSRRVKRQHQKLV